MILKTNCEDLEMHSQTDKPILNIVISKNMIQKDCINNNLQK